VSGGLGLNHDRNRAPKPGSFLAALWHACSRPYRCYSSRVSISEFALSRLLRLPCKIAKKILLFLPPPVLGIGYLYN
jgi:hypothetical protein